MKDDFVCVGYYSDTDPKCYLCPDSEKCKHKTMLRKLKKEIDRNSQYKENRKNV